MSRRRFAGDLLPDWHFERPKWEPIRERASEQRQRHVIDGNAHLRAAFRKSAVRMAVNHERDRISSYRLLEAARSEKRINLERLALLRALGPRGNVTRQPSHPPEYGKGT